MDICTAIVEDDAAIREGLAAMLNRSPGFRCIGTYGSGEEAIAQLPGNDADVVLMDIHLLKMTGIECVFHLKQQYPALEIMMLSSFGNEEYILDSLTAGATGYILKQSTSEQILDAIRELHNGGSPMSRSIARRVVQQFQQKAKSSDKQLTPREEEILSFLSKGLRYKEIAGKLFISTNTVRNHIHIIYEKLHVTSRTEAVVMYMKK